jgi:hypothetical protein
MPPPTIGKLKAMGVRQFAVTCARPGCRHSSKVTFKQAGLPDEMYFPDIAYVRRFTCTACGAREVAVTPDWTTHRAAGN